MGTDVKLAGDVDKPLLGCVEVREANAPWAINNVDRSFTAVLQPAHT